MAVFEPALGTTLVHSHTKASGAEITTGTNTEKLVTPKALSDADVNTRLKSKAISGSRDLTAASGDVAYTGVGFTPTSMTCYSAISGGVVYSIASADSARTMSGIVNYYNATLDVGAFISNIVPAAGAQQSAVVKSYDSDGFTLTWTKVGSPTGTGSLRFFCVK